MRDELAQLFRNTDASNAAIFIKRGDSVECMFSTDRKPPQSVTTNDGIDVRKAVADLARNCMITHASLFVEKEKNVYKLIEE